MSQTKEYCQNCGVAITEPSAFCSSCGAALTPSGAPSGAAAAPMSATAHSPEPPPATPTPDAPGITQAAPPAGQAPPPPAGSQPASSESPKGSRNWIPYAAAGGTVVLVVALVAVLLLTLGGSAGKNIKSASVTRQQALQLLANSGATTVSNAAPGLFALVKTGKLTAIVPAGWHATAQTASGTTRATFTDPKHSGSSLTIVTQGASRENAHHQAAAALKAVKNTGDTISSYGPVTFPGGREAWQVTYKNAGLTNETYFFSACGGKAAMVIDVATSTTTFGQEQATLGAVAASAEPMCS